MSLINLFQAIFMIPTKPPPSFRNPDKWSPEFIDFVSKCLIKNPDQRVLAKELLEVNQQNSAYSKTCLKLPLKNRQNKGLNGKL